MWPYVGDSKGGDYGPLLLLSVELIKWKLVIKANWNVEIQPVGSKIEQMSVSLARQNAIRRKSQIYKKI